MIDVVLVDDHQYVIDAFRDALSLDPEIRIVGEAHDGVEALDIVRSARPHVVVMDIVMPLLNGIETTRRLSRPPTVVVVTVHEEPQYLMQAVQAGAVGCLPKRLAGVELHAAVSAAARGEGYFSPTIPTPIRACLFAALEASGPPSQLR